MTYQCNRCLKYSDKLFEVGDVESTAMISAENNLPMPQIIYVCLSCAFDLMNISKDDLQSDSLSDKDEISIIDEVESQKSLMIDVSTGGSRIDDVNDEYQDRRRRIRSHLNNLNITDPNPYPDLWSWYGKWSSGDLPSYQSRREFITALYQQLLDILEGDRLEKKYEPIKEPTGWIRVDRGVDKIIKQLEIANTEEDFQVVGLLCRETLISLAQAIYDPTLHSPIDNITPSKTDAKRMLECYFSSEISGKTNEGLRRHAKASLSLAQELQHKRTAHYQDAALCAEATRTVINIISIISGRSE